MLNCLRDDNDKGLKLKLIIDKVYKPKELTPQQLLGERFNSYLLFYFICTFNISQSFIKVAAAYCLNLALKVTLQIT